MVHDRFYHQNGLLHNNNAQQIVISVRISLENPEMGIVLFFYRSGFNQIYQQVIRNIPFSHALYRMMCQSNYGRKALAVHSGNDTLISK